MSLDQFRADHRQIVETVNRLLHMIDPAHPETIERISQLRLELASLSDAHIKSEQSFVAKTLGESSDYVARTIARRYDSGLMDLQLSLTAHMGKWNAALVQSDPAGYRQAVRDQFAASMKRLEWEERVVFPLIDYVRGGDPKAPQEKCAA